jgi:predicted esterase
MSIMRFLFATIIGLLPTLGMAQPIIKEITTRPGVTVKFLYYKAEKPKATAILFTGGSGVVGIFPNGQTRNEGFSPTSAQFYLENNMSVIVPDAPSDRSHLNKFRSSLDHAFDNSELVKFLKQEANVPLWAIGHSNGALSAAALATQLQGKGLDGIVLASATTKTPFGISSAHSVLEATIEEIYIPVLIVHHKEDKCQANPFDGSRLILDRLKKSINTEITAIEGGTNSMACGPDSHHSYGGITSITVKKIANWIQSAAKIRN